MQYAVLIEREPEAPTVAAYSPGVNLTVIREDRGSRLVTVAD